MKTISIELDKSQFIRILNKLDDNDKLEIYNELKKSLFLKRFNKLLKSTKSNELTLEEITKEVESVRRNVEFEIWNDYFSTFLQLSLSPMPSVHRGS
ncbi:MAG: hypothetical protein Q8P34_12750, partial [Bacteroidota bacterium]|nr:hypothetical protein [Bacteroidota bacterium]